MYFMNERQQYNAEGTHTSGIRHISGIMRAVPTECINFFGAEAIRKLQEVVEDPEMKILDRAVKDGGLDRRAAVQYAATLPEFQNLMARLRTAVAEFAKVAKEKIAPANIARSLEVHIVQDECPAYTSKKDSGIQRILSMIENFTEKDDEGTLKEFFMIEFFMAFCQELLAIIKNIELPEISEAELKKLIPGQNSLYLRKNPEKRSEVIHEMQKRALESGIKNAIVAFYEKHNRLQEAIQQGKIQSALQFLDIRKTAGLMPQLSEFAKQYGAEVGHFDQGMLERYNADQAAEVSGMSILRGVQDATESIERKEVHIFPTRNVEENAFKICHVDIVLNRKDRQSTTIRLSVFRGDHPICIGDTVTPLTNFLDAESYELLRCKILDIIWRNLQGRKDEWEDLLIGKGGTDITGERTEEVREECRYVFQPYAGGKEQSSGTEMHGENGEPAHDQIPGKQVKRPKLTISARRVRQILINILGNPIDTHGSHCVFQPKGGGPRIHVPLHEGHAVNPYVLLDRLRALGIEKEFFERM